jgi:hypothetical protein
VALVPELGRRLALARVAQPGVHVGGCGAGHGAQGIGADAFFAVAA